MEMEEVTHTVTEMEIPREIPAIIHMGVGRNKAIRPHRRLGVEVVVDLVVRRSCHMRQLGQGKMDVDLSFG